MSRADKTVQLTLMLLVAYLGWIAMMGIATLSHMDKTQAIRGGTYATTKYNADQQPLPGRDTRGSVAYAKRAKSKVEFEARLQADTGHH